jgi:uncharacterized membrane protein YhaH (DUF805 family)
MKLCSQCKKENPSSANHCMYCGAALVEEEQLPEEVKLQKKLTEQEEENKLLKAALEAQLKQQKTQENTQKTASVVETVAPPAITIVEQQPVKVSVSGYSEVKTEMPGPKRMFSHPFSFKGRIRRLEYGLSCIIYFVWYFIMTAWCESDETSGGFFVLMTIIPVLWFFWAQGTKRCHDRNNSGWYQIIPLYGLWMLFAEGDGNENNYGFPPK